MRSNNMPKPVGDFLLKVVIIALVLFFLFVLVSGVGAEYEAPASQPPAHTVYLPIVAQQAQVIGDPWCESVKPEECDVH